MKEVKRITKWFYWFLLGVSLIVIYKILDNVGEISTFLSNFTHVIMPFIIAIIIAYLFYTPSDKLEQLLKKNKYLKKKARIISIVTVYVLAILILVLVIKGIIPTIINSVMEIVKSIPDYYNWLLGLYDGLSKDSILRNIDMHAIINKLKEVDYMQYISISNVSTYISGAISAVGILFDIFVSFIFSIYLLIERHSIKNFFIKLIRAISNEKVSRNVIEYVGKTNHIFLSFIYCQILDGIVVGIILSIAFSFMKIKYAIMLGAMIGLLNIIPYFGAIIGVVIAVLITIFTGGINQALVMLVVAIALQQIDSNIINPRILGEGLKVSPIIIIFAVTVGGAYFGVLGMFLAVPIAAILKIILEDYVEYKLRMKKEKEQIINKKNKKIEEA